MRSQRHDFTMELREHTIPLFETVEPQTTYKMQLLSQLSCSDFLGAAVDLHTVIKHNNVLEIELRYVGTSPQYEHRSFSNMLFQEPSLKINNVQIFDSFEITGSVPEQYSFSIRFNEPYQTFSQLKPVLSKNLEFQLVGLINNQRIVLCYRQAQVIED